MTRQKTWLTASLALTDQDFSRPVRVGTGNVVIAKMSVGADVVSAISQMVDN